jgi:hypothetical protein
MWINEVRGNDPARQNEKEKLLTTRDNASTWWVNPDSNTASGHLILDWRPGKIAVSCRLGHYFAVVVRDSGQTDL